VIAHRSARRGLRRWARLAVALILAPAIAWGAGLVWFAQTIPSAAEQPEARTDAIVVLTGGSLRLKTGLTLLAEGRAGKLFVSGVYRGVDVAELLRVARQAPADLECCVALGYAADNTAGNALETRAWMESEGFVSLRLVTASYHMRRSLLEFRRALPRAQILAHPVQPDSFKQEEWWLWPGTAHLIVQEYHKYLLALIHGASLVSAAAPARPPAAASARQAGA
jgi:uncharacterized SAM-binding protein YcdF (DUF218 family)